MPLTVLIEWFGVKRTEFNFLDFLERKQKKQNMACVFNTLGVKYEKECSKLTFAAFEGEFSSSFQ